MAITTTAVFDKNIVAYTDDNIRIIANKGSTRSSKTYSILQILYFIAKRSKDSLMISVVSESIPHLKRGAIRDFESILRSDNVIIDKIRNKTDNVYQIGNSQIEFFGADSDGKIHGPARDILFINECNNVRYEAYRQLAIRTRGKIFLDFNPVKKFWVDVALSSRNDFTLIHSTYKDNEYLTREQITEIESNRHDANWWNVYGLGITGGTEGLVYPEYDVIKEMPKEFKKACLAVDFGFSCDETAIAIVGIVNGCLYLDEVCYKIGMTNKDIADLIKSEGLAHLNVVADSAEQKSIEELRRERIKCYPAVKGKGSIASGISRVKKYKIMVTERSSNIIDELDNYSWKKDRNGIYINEPEDRNNHCFVGSTMIQTKKGVMRIDSLKAGDIVFTSKGENRVNKLFDNGIKEVCDYILKFKNKDVRISCTEDHLIKTTQGWKKISELQGEETLFLFKHSTEKNTHCMKEKSIIQEEQKNFTMMYGDSTTEKYLKGMKYTTRISTRKTIISKTLNAFRLWSIERSIQQCAGKEDQTRRICCISKISDHLQRSGTHLKRVGNGILNTLKKYSEISKQKIMFANNAELFIRQKKWQTYDSAQTLANLHTEEKQVLIMRREFANNADVHTKQINTLKQSIAEECVLIRIKKENRRLEKVYDINVDNIHEYFANDVLVHNCADAFRYGCNFLERGGSGETSINTI